MSVRRVASRYARALVDLALEQDNLEQVKGDVDTFRGLLQNRDFELMLRSPVIANSKKKSILKQLLEGKVEDLSMKFFSLLVDKERDTIIPEILTEFMEYYREVKHISKLKVTSVQPLKAENLQDIIKHLQEKELIEEHVEVETEIDPGLIGGFILEFDDNIYDASVSNQLTELKREFEENLYRPLVVAR
jgi:F-type H+-transporting ATPase subunit delta